MINQQMHTYKYAQSHIISLLHHDVSVTPMIIIGVSCNNNTIDIQIIVPKCMIKKLGVTLDFLYPSLWTESFKLYYH
jgi:hypothetical protein